LARESSIKVMLDGQGADELLAGYPYFYPVYMASLLREGKLSEAIRFLRHFKAGTKSGLLLKILHRFLPDALNPILQKLWGRSVIDDCLDERWFQERGVRLQSAASKLTTGSDVREVLQDNLAVSSLPHLLRYEDRNSMFYSIESRVPFLTPDLAEFLFRLPQSYLISEHGISKSIFRAAMRGIVPDAILERRDKIGFATPEPTWLPRMHTWGKSAITNSAELPMIDQPKLLRRWDAVAEGRLPYNRYIWRLINLLTWADLFEVESD
jgi:asparagine synthase (glutamine-hydrolysing)